MEGLSGACRGGGRGGDDDAGPVPYHSPELEQD